MDAGGPSEGCHVEERFESTASAVALARNWFARECRRAGVPADTISRGLLPVSEIMSNAVRYGHTPVIRIEIDLTDEVFVAVHDDCSDPPDAGIEPLLDASGGRGLLLASMLADDLGWTRTATGKTVWFRLVTRTAPRRLA